MKYSRQLVYVLILLCVSIQAQARKEPLWELGLGIGGLYMPDYEGSAHKQSFAFPIPYIVYNGDKVTVDRRGVRGDVVRAERFRLNMSGNIGPPVSSDQNGIRLGMPDLDPTIEVGPSLEMILWNSDDRRHVWSFRIPARAVYVTDFSYIEPAGWRLLPNINYDAHDVGHDLMGGWFWGVSAGPVWATEHYHDYYYEVAPEFETSTRPAYDARRGYGGMRVGFAIRKRFKKIWFGAFARYRYLGGAVFEDSPLVKESSSLVVGAGLSYIFSRSDEMVEVDDLFE